MMEMKINIMDVTEQIGMPFIKMTTQKKKLNLLFLLVLLIPFVSAVTLSNTTINNTASNVTINLISAIYFDTLVVGDDGSIYFAGLRDSNLGTETLTFNITGESNKVINGQPVWFSGSSTDSSKRIDSNLTNFVNATVAIDISSDHDCERIQSITYSSNLGTYSKSWGGETARDLCSDTLGTINFPSLEIEASSNVISIEYEELQPFCSGIQQGFKAFGELLVLIVLTVIVVLVAALLMNGDLRTMDLFVISVLSIVFAVILLIFGSIIIESLC